MKIKFQGWTSAGSILFLLLLTAAATTMFASQGAMRSLYTVPNATFIEQPTGEDVITIKDSSGSIVQVQAAIESARSANPDKVIVIHLLRGAIYSVDSAGLVLTSHECLAAEGALIQAAGPSVTVPLVSIAPGSTNVSISGGTMDGQGANIQGIFGAAVSRVNIDRVVVRNFGLDNIFLSGNGNTAYDNEMTVTRSDVSGSRDAGIRIENSTQTFLMENNCHHNDTGIRISAEWASIANNTCHHNTTGIDIADGGDNVVANNTCDENGTGIHAGASNDMIVSNSLGNNSIAGISSTGIGDNFVDNLFTSGNAAGFVSSGTKNNVIAYGSPAAAPGQNYFYPPLIDNQHTESTIVNGMGRTDLTIGSATIDGVQAQYNTARNNNPNNVLVLHLNGTFTVGANPLMLSSNTCVLLNGTIQINAATTAHAAIATSANGQTRISISGGVLDGGNRNGNTGISAIGDSMIQVDGMTIQNFGNNSSHHSGSDSIHFSGGSTPYVVTRCTINKSGARGIWSQLSKQKALYAENTVTLTRACIDDDSHTFGAVMTFNSCSNNTYGIFIEQGAAHNTAIGNIVRNSDRQNVNVFNNNDTPPVQFNSVLDNTIVGGTGIRNGSTSGSFTSHNFYFNNTLLNASIHSDPDGTENFYSQNYQIGSGFSGSGTETIFNSTDVDGNLQIQSRRGGGGVAVENASTLDGANLVAAPSSPLGDGSEDDEWLFVPTSDGFYQVVNKNSGLVMSVQDASLSVGALVVQAPYTADAIFNDEWLLQPVGNGLYNLVNRLSGLYLDAASAKPGSAANFQQSLPNNGSGQQFRLTEDAPVAPLSLPVTASGLLFSRATHTYNGTITVSNNTANVLTGILYVLVTNPTPGVTVGNTSAMISGAPAIQLLDGTTGLNPGDSVSVPIVFNDPSNVRIGFTPALALQ